MQNEVQCHRNEVQCHTNALIMGDRRKPPLVLEQRHGSSSRINATHSSSMRPLLSAHDSRLRVGEQSVEGDGVSTSRSADVPSVSVVAGAISLTSIMLRRDGGDLTCSVAGGSVCNGVVSVAVVAVVLVEVASVDDVIMISSEEIGVILTGKSLFSCT